MKRAFVIVVVLMVFVITLCPSASYSKTITLANGDVYKDACSPIWVGMQIYRFRAATKEMVYVGEVVNVGRAFNSWIVWLWVPESKRIEPRTREAVCEWGWVKIKEAEK